MRSYGRNVWAGSKSEPELVTMEVHFVNPCDDLIGLIILVKKTASKGIEVDFCKNMPSLFSVTIKYGP